ncbi:MAG: helix-turn-helix domain-containing protein [Methylobacter sp.]|nr:helix-turn-helix domain-containing protein [Methylobacter sp.]MDP2100766.1 helix-turn-helix domain-containing protein [Methylobacter sp.]MDP2427037.1 helix-turn-helix domain-containing protein [Methylobacter sp.]MDP3053015.1 helix-turn-helix domain-containing protein [Methylobacter sp.]MDP3362910.1 helix-turn-helix domain-containing protein [Methylobacter sp.]
MRTFTHLTKEERYHIYLMHKKKVSLEEIAKDIGRSKSTISRELRRNKGKPGLVTDVINLKLYAICYNL